MTSVKVLIAIPNMGATQVESYGNRLENFLNIGSFEKERESVFKLSELLDKHAPDKKDAILSEFLQTARFTKTIFDETFEFWFLNIGRFFTPAAREEAAKRSLQHGMDYILFIDDDMICPNDIFQKLYRHHKIADVVCPLAFTRNEPYNPVIYASVDGYDAVNKTDYFINNVIQNYPKGKLVETDACGFGAALVKTSILKRINPPYFMCSEGTGEDILFCYKVKKAGGRVFMDTSFNIGHLSHPQVITEEFVDNYRKSVDNHHEKRYGEFTKYNALTILGD